MSSYGHVPAPNHQRVPLPMQPSHINAMNEMIKHDFKVSSSTPSSDYGKKFTRCMVIRVNRGFNLLYLRPPQ